MAHNGPIASKLSSSDTPFQLRSYETDPIIFQAITKLPLEATLKELEELPPFISKTISHAIENIYSHVTQRTPDEESEHFFHHPASTVYYETHYKTLVKGKDHTKKASSLVQMVEQTIKDIENRLNQPLCSSRQVEILTNFRNIFIVHQVAFNKALQQASPTKKAHLKKYQNHDVENIPIIPISPSKKQSIAKSYSAPPSPSKGPLTPRKLSENDRLSIDYLRSLNPNAFGKSKKKLIFELSPESSDFEDSEESKEVKGVENIGYYFDEDFSDKSEDSLDDFLTKGMDTLIFRPMTFGLPCKSTAKKLETTSKEKTKKSNQNRYF